MAGALNLLDKARGLIGPDNVVELILLEEVDFTVSVVDWPLRTTATAGEITSAVPTAATLPRLRFAIQTGKSAAKKNAGKGPGHETWSHDGLQGEFVGVTKEQWVVINGYHNKPVVAIALYPDGNRKVFGSKQVPLQLIFEEMQDVEGGTVKAELKHTGVLDFPPCLLGSAVALTLVA